MFEREKILLGIDLPKHNLDGWQLKDNGLFYKQGYSVVANNDTYTIIDPDSNTTTDDVLYPLHTAITKVNELLKPHIELEFNSTRFNLVPLDWKVIEPLMNKVLIVYNKGVELGTLTMECDDVPTGVSISDMSNPILLALKDYLNEWLDD